jgi:RimJ/RimL family protein N-acetyltransferase
MAEAWIATHISDFLAGRALHYAITRREIGVIGAIRLGVQARHRKGDLGYWVAVDYWGQGYATEAARAVIEFGAKHFELEKITAHHLIENPASGRVMQKLGMVEEGVLHGEIVKDDRRHDIVVYGLLL